MSLEIIGNKVKSWAAIYSFVIALSAGGISFVTWAAEQTLRDYAKKDEVATQIADATTKIETRIEEAESRHTAAQEELQRSVDKLASEQAKDNETKIHLQYTREKVESVESETKEIKRKMDAGFDEIKQLIIQQRSPRQ
jgi:outer membrane murein-binding lipoprotein Lpp